MKNSKLTRREFLGLSAVVAAGSVVTACSTPPTATPVPVVPTKAPAAPAPTAVPAACAKGDICVRAPFVKMPADKVTFRWLDSGDTKAIFNKAMFEAYGKVYPNITFQYDGLPWNEIAKVVPLGVQNGNLHDVFSIPQGVTTAQAVAEGWLQPFDGLVPTLDKVKASFPAASFIEGINVFGGKTYSLPLGTNKRSATMLLYNTEYMQKAGYDPLAKPFSWDDFRAAAKKITEQGAGKYYGFIMGGNQLGRYSAIIGDLARLAGVSYVSNNAVGSIPEDFINLKTGEYVFTEPAWIAAIELLLALKADGSFFPGFLSLTAPQARAQIAQGAAGMILQGLWCIPSWQRDNKDFKYGIAMTPTQTAGKFSHLHVAPGGDNAFFIFAKSKVAEVGAELLAYRSTLEGQLAWNKIAGIGDPAILPEAMETASTNPLDVAGLKLQSTLFRTGPYPVVRNPEISKVNLERKTVTPSFEQVAQGLLSGQVTDVKKAMTEVKDAYSKELDRAIKAAQDKGAKVQRSDFAFSNWDPTKDYTEAEYKALK